MREYAEHDEDDEAADAVHHKLKAFERGSNGNAPRTRKISYVQQGSGGGGGGGSQRLELVEFFIVLAGDCFSCLLIFTYSVCSLFVYVMFL